LLPFSERHPRSTTWGRERACLTRNECAQMIDEGSFGVVEKAKFRGEDVVVKTLQGGLGAKNKPIQQLLREISLETLVRSPSAGGASSGTVTPQTCRECDGSRPVR
jgi:hypothetical protein